MPPADAASVSAILKGTFEAVSVGYDRSVLRFFGDAAERLAASLELGGNEHVLDVATGTGHLALAVARRLTGGSVTGIDFAPGMLEQARRKAAAQGARNADFREMDMLDLDFPPETFDVVVCAFGIFFAEDMDAQLGRLLGLVKPGGKLAISNFEESYFSPLKELMVDRLTRYGATMPVQTWRSIAHEAGCRELFARAGLTDVRVERWDCGYHLRDAEEWWEVVWNAGFRRWVCQLSASNRERFRREHLEEVAALGTPDGIRLEVGVLATRGVKEPGRCGP